MLFYKTRKIILLIIFFVCGCVSAEELQGLMTLKRLSGNQAQQEKYMKIQEAKFKKLLRYIKDGKLEKGRSRKWVLSAFGEPILTKTIDDDAYLKEFLMYRHPDQFFGSERVYLYFNENESLVSWRYEEGY
jgi:hypothetical protein